MRVICCLILSLLVLGVAPAASAGENKELMKEVAAIGDALAKAMLEDDIDTMLGMYADDAISLPNFGPRIDGAEAFKKNHEQMAAAGMKIKSFTSDPTDVWAVANQVVEIGTYKIAIDMPGAPALHIFLVDQLLANASRVESWVARKAGQRLARAAKLTARTSKGRPLQLGVPARM